MRSVSIMASRRRGLPIGRRWGVTHPYSLQLALIRLIWRWVTPFFVLMTLFFISRRKKSSISSRRFAGTGGVMPTVTAATMNTPNATPRSGRTLPNTVISPASFLLQTLYVDYGVYAYVHCFAQFLCVRGSKRQYLIYAGMSTNDSPTKTHINKDIYMSLHSFTAKTSPRLEYARFGYSTRA